MNRDHTGDHEQPDRGENNIGDESQDNLMSRPRAATPVIGLTPEGEARVRARVHFLLP